MDNKTTQYDKRLSEYRDRLLQRNKEMTADDDELIDSIINQNEPENSKADGKADGTSEEKMADSVSDASSAKETPVSESYKEYADKLESVLKEVGVATAEKSESKQPTERIKEDRVAEERKRLAYKKLGYEEQTQDDTMESEADMDESEEDGHTFADVFANLRENVRDAVGEAEKKVRSRKPVRSEVGNDGQKRSFRLNTLGKWAVTGIVLFVVFLILTIGYVSANKSYKYNQMDIRPIKNSDLVVNEGVKVLSSVKAPVFASKLAVYRMRDLKHIHVVEAGEQSLVALVVGNAVEHFGVHPLVVVAVEGLAEQEEILCQPLAVTVQLLEEVQVKAVRYVKAQAVYPEFLLPAGYAVLEVLLHLGVVEVELYQLVMTLPALVPEAVVVAVVALAHMEPVLLSAAELVLADVPESPEVAPDMVEHAVQNDPDTVFVKRVADLLEILVCAEAAVYLGVISGVVAVRGGFKYRPEVYGVAAKLLYMRDIVNDPEYLVGRFRREIVLPGAAEVSDWVDVIEYSVFKPVHKAVLLRF